MSDAADLLKLMLVEHYFTSDHQLRNIRIIKSKKRRVFTELLITK